MNIRHAAWGLLPYGHDRREYYCETMGLLLLAVKLRA